MKGRDSMPVLPLGPAVGQHGLLRTRGLYVRLFGLACLAFLAYPLLGLSGRSPLLYLPLVAFGAGYAGVIWRNTPYLHTNQTPWLIVGTLASGAVLLPTLRGDWLSGMGFFASIMLLVNYPLRWWRSILAGLVATLILVATLALDARPQSVLTLVLIVVIVSGVQVAVYKQTDTSLQLQQARLELARLAVADERLRIARDMHDILGQRLSAISIRAELAGRVVRPEPERAELEMAELAGLARDALAEVRAAVAGYRQASLATETQSAAALLSASGVDVTVTGEVCGLPQPADECAAWVVREAITNTVRHANARRCEIVLSHVDDAVVVEVRDDGNRSRRTELPAFGTGLTGLAERVTMVGGVFGVELRDGWFVVRASLPTRAVVSEAS